MEKLNPASPMQLVSNLAENWKRFKQRFNIYFAASGAGGDDEKVKSINLGGHPYHSLVWLMEKHVIAVVRKIILQSVAKLML